MLNLDVKNRGKEEKLSVLRDSGFIPAIFYGPKEKSTPISVILKDFKKVWEEAGESTVVTLKTDKGQLETLIHQVDKHPVTNEPIHVDFYAMEAGKTVEVEVPLEFVGVSPAQKGLGGHLVKVMYEIEVEALPKDLPQQIEVDISSLIDFESSISAKDVILPSGVSLVTGPDEVIALVEEASEEEPEEAPQEGADLSKIEVEKKGKDEDESKEPGGKSEDAKSEG